MSIINEDSLLGDLVRIQIEQLKQLDRPWQHLSEKEQNRIIGLVNHETKKAVREACNIINKAGGKVTIRAQVESVAFKDSIKVGLKVAAENEGRHDLADSAGDHVDIVILKLGDLVHDGGLPTATPDQGTLKMDDASGE